MDSTTFLHLVATQSTNPIVRLVGDSPFVIFINVVALSACAFFGWRWIIQPIYLVLRNLWDVWRAQKAQLAFLEITPPKHSEKSPLATEQLFAIIQELSDNQSRISLEITSNHQDGIRYIIGLDKRDIPALQKHVASYLPQARFNVLAATEATQHEYNYVFELKQSRHYAYPLKAQEMLDQSDPVAYIAGAMTKPNEDEQLALQLIITPHSSYWTNRIRNQLRSKGYAVVDGRVLYFLKTRPLWVWIVTVAYGTLTNNLLVTLQLLGFLLVVTLFLRREEPAPTPGQQEMSTNMLTKLDQPLFKTDIRLAVTGSSESRSYEALMAAASSFGALSTPGFQQLSIVRLFPTGLGQKISKLKLMYRLPSFYLYDSSILAASELASIYHFPYGTIQTEGMTRSHSRTLPAPTAMKNADFDVVLGENHHHGEVTPIGLTATERERHVFIVGGTGNGKTTMLQYALVQDIQSGKGVAVIDPHGDMAETLLHYIPEDRINDVIYFNPDDLDYPIGLNLLELTPGLEGNDLLREKDRVTESVVSVFRKIFSDDDSGGHRIEYVLRNTIQTALCVEDATLFTVYDLLNDPAYRKQVLKSIDDKNLQNFWKQELGKAGDMQKVKMAAGITAKIGRFLFSASAKRILEQPKSTINFDDIINSRKILICNFSKGLIGEDTSELFGIAVLAKLQLAAYRRVSIPPAKRRPFYVYVDEFQNFATPSFVQMLSESRKYKLSLTMAEQSTSQQDDQQMVNTILANVGTVICFRSGNPADEKLILPLFEPYIEKGEIANLPSFNFYIRVMASRAQEPASGSTMVLRHEQISDASMRAVRASRERYSKKQTHIEKLALIHKSNSNDRPSLPGMSD